MIEKENNYKYSCPVCGFLYKDPETAKKCEAWCKKHSSCNLEIISHGKPPQDNK